MSIICKLINKNTKITIQKVRKVIDKKNKKAI